MVGSPPDPLPPALKQAPPGRVSFSKNNTPTAFTPQPTSPSSPGLEHRSSSSQRPLVAESGQPRSREMPRPPTLGMSAAVPPLAERGSSGPQALTHKQQSPSGQSGPHTHPPAQHPAY